VYDQQIKQELKQIIKIQLKDNIKARILDNDLKNHYVQESGSQHRSQTETYKYLQDKTIKHIELSSN